MCQNCGLTQLKPEQPPGFEGRTLNNSLAGWLAGKSDFFSRTTRTNTNHAAAASFDVQASKVSPPDGGKFCSFEALMAPGHIMWY
jgi:hypothetical protein